MSIFGSVPTGTKAGGGTTRKWVNLQQRMTQREIEGGKPGRLYRKNNDGVYVAQDSVTGFIAFVTQKRSYQEDQESRCWSPDAVVGRGKAGVHGMDPVNRKCQGCPFREKEEGASSKCAISWEVTLVEDGTNEELTIELRKTSYPAGTALMALLQGESEPEKLAVTFSGEKVKAYYRFQVEAAEGAGQAPANMGEISARLRSEWQDRLLTIEEPAATKEPQTEAKDLSGDIPF
jgi:hypothetical protein